MLHVRTGVAIQLAFYFLKAFLGHAFSLDGEKVGEGMSLRELTNSKTRHKPETSKSPSPQRLNMASALLTLTGETSSSHMDGVAKADR